MGSIIPSFRDLDTTKDQYNTFSNTMVDNGITVDLSYDQWCDLFEVNGCVEDLLDLYVVPNSRSEVINEDNAIVADRDEMSFLMEVVTTPPRTEPREFEVLVEPTLEERYREINITTDKGHLIDDYYEQYGDNGDD